MAVAEAISAGGVPVALIDSDSHDTAASLALVMSEAANVDDRLLIPVLPGSDESAMIGALGILIAVTGETRVDSLLKRYARCQALEVPVVRIILIDAEPLRRLNDWAAPALANL